MITYGQCGAAGMELMGSMGELGGGVRKTSLRGRGLALNGECGWAGRRGILTEQGPEARRAVGSEVAQLKWLEQNRWVERERCGPGSG